MSTPRVSPPEALNRRPQPAARNDGMRFFFVLSDLARTSTDIWVQESADDPPLWTDAHADPLIAPSVPSRAGLIVLNHAARYPGVDGQAEVRTACHSEVPHDRWAGPPRNQGATAPTPEPKTSSLKDRSIASGRSFRPGAGPPSCTPAPQPSGWSPTRTTPTTNNRRKHSKHNG
jgi:hypothetical protein